MTETIYAKMQFDCRVSFVLFFTWRLFFAHFWQDEKLFSTCKTNETWTEPTLMNCNLIWFWFTELSKMFSRVPIIPSADVTSTATVPDSSSLTSAATASATSDDQPGKQTSFIVAFDFVRTHSILYDCFVVLAHRMVVECDRRGFVLFNVTVWC